MEGHASHVSGACPTQGERAGRAQASVRGRVKTQCSNFSGRRQHDNGEKMDISKMGGVGARQIKKHLFKGNPLQRDPICCIFEEGSLYFCFQRGEALLSVVLPFVSQ